MPCIPIPRLLNTEQAANLLCLSPRTLESLRLRGGGPEFLKLGKAVRYKPQAINAWIEARRAHPTSEQCG